MPKGFDISNPPFDRLTSREAETLRASLDVAYFRPGETIIGTGVLADALYVIIKGTVEERDQADLLALLGLLRSSTAKSRKNWMSLPTMRKRDVTAR